MGTRSASALRLGARLDQQRHARARRPDYIAAGAYLSGSLRAGSDCTVNPYTVVRGEVDARRRGAHRRAHLAAGLQPHDGRPGRRGLPAAADQPGHPHRRRRVDRLPRRRPRRRHRSATTACSARARSSPRTSPPGRSSAATRPAAPLPARRHRDAARPGRRRASAALRRHRPAPRPRTCSTGAGTATGLSSTSPGAAPTVRAHCDAVEIADLLLGAAPRAARRRRAHRAAARLAGPGHRPGRPSCGRRRAGRRSATAARGRARATTCCASGYALDLLGDRLRRTRSTSSRTRRPPELVAGWTPCRGATRRGRAGAGSTARHRAALEPRRGGVGQPGAAGGAVRLAAHRTPTRGPGCGASPTADRGPAAAGQRLLPATRGSFAQFGLPVPYPERRDRHRAGPRARPPLLRPGPAERLQRARRRAPALARAAADRPPAPRRSPAGPSSCSRDALRRWNDGAGFGFGPAPGDRGADRDRPGLQGTEMWLAIIWLLADLVGVSDGWATARGACTGPSRRRPRGPAEVVPVTRDLPGRSWSWRTTPELQFDDRRRARLAQLSRDGQVTWTGSLDDPAVADRLAEVEVLLTGWGTPLIGDDELLSAPALPARRAALRGNRARDRRQRRAGAAASWSPAAPTSTPIPWRSSRSRRW